MTGRLHIHIHIHMSTYLYLSIYLPIYLSTYLSIYLPTHHLPTCTSVNGWKQDGVPAATGGPIWGDATLCCFNSVFGREKMRPSAHREALGGALKSTLVTLFFPKRPDTPLGRAEGHMRTKGPCTPEPPLVSGLRPRLRVPWDKRATQ